VLGEELEHFARLGVAPGTSLAVQHLAVDGDVKTPLSPVTSVSESMTFW
jgi:hypothetical protein